ncbi:MAG: LuxR family transcriptional regulator [Chloroflexi bacterium CFX2]|nr:LuxR family transcriptional regulator [Chloroflexi bacterium CFX2]
MMLLERDLHFKALRSALDEAAREGRLGLVYGEAGIGKTSLVEHFINKNKESWRILQGACDSLFTPRPLGPLHDIALQTQGQLLALLDSESNRTAIFSACLNELKDQKTILFMEDVHWADEATLDLLKYLGRRIRQTTSLIILTFRDDELGMDHPLRLLLGDLASSQALHRIPVSSLSNDAVHELAKNKKVDPLELHRLTNGNPFYVTEVLAVESGIPETVRDAVLARAARLSAAARSVLEAAAVIGSRVEPWLLSNIVGAESENVKECIAAGMLQSQGNDYAFRHELARQTILETISPERRLALHRMILSVLKESPETRKDLARLANHAEGTKDVYAVLEYAPAAAQQASAASSHREAITLYELALRFSDSLPPASHAQMLEAYAIELWYADRMTEMMSALQKAIELWHSIGDRRREGDNLGTLAVASYSNGRKAEAEQASQLAIAILEALPPGPELARAYRSQCFIRMENRDLAEAVIWGEKAIALAEQFDDLETVARACNYAGCSLLVVDYERGRALMERSLQIGREANLPITVAGTLANLAQTFGELYQFEDAERYLTEGIAYATEHDDDYHLQEMFTWQSSARLYQGHWHEVKETLLKVLPRPNFNLPTYTYALLILGRLRVRLGEASALATLDEGLALSIQVESMMRLEYARAARAEMGWLVGEPDRAIEEVRAVYDIAVSKEHPWVAGELAFWRWRGGDTFKPPAWIAKPFALQIAGDWHGAAEEWERRSCPYEQAMALMDGNEAAQLATLEIFERLGAKPIIEILKQRMRAQGIRIPRGPRPATRENPLGLTAREMEVLSCLVNGQSNNAIAKKLSLSTRTVEHHIASILQKLGVESRNEAVVVALKKDLLSSE